MEARRRASPPTEGRASIRYPVLRCARYVIDRISHVDEICDVADLWRRKMAISEKLSMLSSAQPAEYLDSVRARQAVKRIYKKAGGRPTPELERVYGEYLRYQRDKKRTPPPRKD